MPRNQIDWETIEREYRVGQKSLRVLAAEFNTTPGAISKKSKKLQWVQDKSDEIRKRTQAALLKETPKETFIGNSPTREDVNNAVQTNLSVILGHRGDIRQGRDLIKLLAGQLGDVAGARDELEKEIIDETEGDEGKPNLRRRNFMLKAVSLPVHAGVLRDLSTAIKNLIPLERQAFNLDEPGANIADVLAALPREFREAVRAALTDAVS